MKTELLITLRQPVIGHPGGHLEAVYQLDIDRRQLDQGISESLNRQIQQSLIACRRLIRQTETVDRDNSQPSTVEVRPESSRCYDGKHSAGFARDTDSGESISDSAPHSASNQRSLSATTKQLRAIHAIAGKMKLEPVRFVRELYPVERLDQLSLAQASSVIDALKRQQKEQLV